MAKAECAVVFIVEEEVIKKIFSNYMSYCTKRGYDYVAFTSIIGKDRTHFKDNSKADLISKDMVNRGEGRWAKKEREIA